MIDSQSSTQEDVVTLPRLPPEILAHILEIAILTSVPCPLGSTSDSSSSSLSPEPPSTTASSSSSSADSTTPTTPFGTSLASSCATQWSSLSNYLYVCRQFYLIVRPLLLHTLTLDRPTSSLSFFQSITVQHSPDGKRNELIPLLGVVQRAWLGNISALHRAIGCTLDPVALRLHEAAWYHECPGGFVVGHAYASRPKHKPIRIANNDAKLGSQDGKTEKKYERISVYWAEEELIQEVRDPNISSPSSSSSSSSSASEDEVDQSARGAEHWSRSSASSETSGAGGSGEPNSAIPSESRPSPSTARRRSSNQQTRDPRIDRPHEPAWQTLYSVQRRARRNNLPRSAAPSTLDNANNLNNAASSSTSRFAGVAVGPSEGELDPWEMQEAQERLATLAAQPPDCGEDTSITPLSQPSPNARRSNLVSDHYGSGQTDDQSPSPTQEQQDRRQLSDSLASTLKKLRRNASRRREIYAYHICTATLEPWINAFLASIRTLRFITITFYPGHILDDDKLEHMLRRILSSAENPKLEVLLIRMLFEPSVAGSRMRRFERAKTIGGAVDRIGDDRVRVMLVPNTVGNGTLSTFDNSHASPAPGDSNRHNSAQQQQQYFTQSPQKQQDQVQSQSEEPILNPLSRRAVQLTKDGWWSRVLQQNRSGVTQSPPPHPSEAQSDAPSPSLTNTDNNYGSSASRTGWQMFFGPEKGRADWMGKVVDSCNPWPDDPIHLEADLSKSSQTNPNRDARNRQLQYLNGWAARDRTNSNAPIEE